MSTNYKVLPRTYNTTYNLQVTVVGSNGLTLLKSKHELNGHWITMINNHHINTMSTVCYSLACLSRPLLMPGLQANPSPGDRLAGAWQPHSALSSQHWQGLKVERQGAQAASLNLKQINNYR